MAGNKPIFSTKGKKRLESVSHEKETTIKKVTAREVNRKRVFSNHNEVRKNLLDDAVGEESREGKAAHTPSLFDSGNKAKILANFEEWIKLATDNKINVKNSWNFALIDYFYDLNVLKETNGNINFQKASATLDGCIKIYASRIDSVANETGKLLSGLVSTNQSSNAANNSEGNNFQGDQDIHSGDVVIDEITGRPIFAASETEDLVDGFRRRVTNRVLETTLTSFDNLKIAAFDEQFIVDPLFKKALADFDEAGAKNLLLSILHIQSDAKVVFDTTEENAQSHDQGLFEKESINVKENIRDDLNENIEIEDKSSNLNSDVEMEDENEVVKEDEINASKNLLPPVNLEYKSTVDDKEEEQYLMAMDRALLNLGVSLGLDDFGESKELCPSIKYVRESVGDLTKVKNLLENVVQTDQHFVTNNRIGETLDIKEVSDQLADDILVNDFEPDNLELEAINALDDDVVVDEHMAENIFNNDDHNNEADMSETMEPNKSESSMEIEEEEVFDLNFEKNLFNDFNGILNNKSWTGKDHWKVKNIKKKVNSTESIDGENINEPKNLIIKQRAEKIVGQKAKKKKQRAHIDFLSWAPGHDDMVLHSESLKVNGVRRIDIPLKNRKDVYYNLLPTDYHVTLEKMTVLFTRPLQKGNFFRKNMIPTMKRTLIDDVSNSKFFQDEELKDGQEEYWANVYENQDIEGGSISEDLSIEKLGINDDNAFDDLQGGMGLDFNDVLGNEEGIVFDSEVKIKSEDPIALNAGLLLSTADDSEKQTTLKAMLAINATQKVNYSRVAKKVDIKKLKDNIWRCIESQLMHLNADERKELKFTNIIEQLKTLYTFESIKDLSTSFCFICLLHLANEQGFRIDKDDVSLADLTLVF
ncbi:hypothetical protein QEN19_003420 [Hanseniaspora menglaensis]